MPVLMSTEEFAQECAQRRVDYNALFERRITPSWLLRFEEQVLNECRTDLSYLDDPAWKRIFEMRVEELNKARERE